MRSDFGGLAEGLNTALQQYMGTAINFQQKKAEQSNTLATQYGLKDYESQLETTRQSKLQDAELKRQKELALYKSGLRDPNQPSKADMEQDKLEKQALDRITQVRGDQSLMRMENQRDASIQAFNTIKQIKAEGRMPSKLEYYDLLGQMWKARTGASPTDQAIKDLDSSTVKGDLNKAVTYFGGNPTKVGATTGDVLNNLHDFVGKTGLQTDKMWNAYMAPRMVKPKGLNNDRWEPISRQTRGLGFQEATGYDPNAGNSVTPSAGKANNDPLGLFSK